MREGRLAADSLRVFEEFSKYDYSRLLGSAVFG
jgi:hypothetical protein